MSKRPFVLSGVVALLGLSCVAVVAQSQSPGPQPTTSTRPKHGSEKPQPASEPAKPTAPQAAEPQPAAPQPAAPQSARAATGEFQPVVQARAANITTCMDKIVGMSARVIDRPHSAVSTYVQAAPNENVFEAIVGMNYPNKEMPNGAAVVLAAPIGATKCQGQTIQIYPTTNSCTAVQASLVKNGHTLTSLNSLPLLQTKDGTRDLLIPTAGGGCVVVGIALH